MALQMEDPPSADVTELASLDRMEAPTPHAQLAQTIARRSQMDRDTLVPVRAINSQPVRLDRRRHNNCSHRICPP
jgi:hypothetical protein